jgi:glycine/D-amino acid oxidase-like deaminating enzyme
MSGMPPASTAGLGARATSPVGWDADPVVAARTPLPSLDADLTADVCVIGLGGSGLAAVGEALDGGLAVVGLDAGRVGAGAAGRNGGILTPAPGIGYARAAASWGLPELAAFHAAATAEIDALVRLLGPGVIRRGGGIRLVEAPWGARSATSGAAGPAGTTADPDDPSAEWADAAEQRRVLETLGAPVEDYDGPLGRGLYLPDEASMNPARRVIGLADRYSRGARLYERSPVTAIDRTVVRTAGGSVSAGLVVVAVDGRLAHILPELADRVRPVRLQMLSTEPVAAGLLPCPVHLRWGFDYAQQDGLGRLFFGGGRDQTVATEFTDDAAPSAPVQAWIEGQARRLVGGPVTVTHRWAASAGYTADGRPVVGAVRPGVVAAGGYSGTGNIVGVLAAKAALRCGLSGTEPPIWFATPA